MPVDSTVQITDEELTSNLNYLQPTGFRVVIDRTKYPNLEYFAQSVSHPGAQLTPLELPVRRITSGHIVSKYLRDNGFRFQEIAKTLQRTNHTTSCYSVRRAEELLEIDHRFRGDYKKFLNA